MSRTFTSIMLGFGLGLLLLSPVNAEDTFSMLKGVSAELLSQEEMKSIEGKLSFTLQGTDNVVPAARPGYNPYGTSRSRFPFPTDDSGSTCFLDSSACAGKPHTSNINIIKIR